MYLIVRIDVYTHVSTLNISIIGRIFDSEEAVETWVEASRIRRPSVHLTVRRKVF